MSYMPFSGTILPTADGEQILLKYIESICITNDGVDATANKLKGDFVFSVRMISGKEHKISMNTLYHSMNGGILMGRDLAQAVIDRWEWINRQ